MNHHTPETEASLQALRTYLTQKNLSWQTVKDIVWKVEELFIDKQEI